MSDGLTVGGVSVGLGDTRNIDSRVSFPKDESHDLHALPGSFYPSENFSLEYASPVADEFAGLGDLSIASDISEIIPGINEIEAEERFAFQAMGGATPPGFEGQGASYRPEHLQPANQINELAERFANL